MRMSNDRKTDLFNAIRVEVMDARVVVHKLIGSGLQEGIEDLLADLDLKIWDRVKLALDIEDF